LLLLLLLLLLPPLNKPTSDDDGGGDDYDDTSVGLGCRRRLSLRSKSRWLVRTRCKHLSHVGFRSDWHVAPSQRETCGSQVRASFIIELGGRWPVAATRSWMMQRRLTRTDCSDARLQSTAAWQEIRPLLSVAKTDTVKVVLGGRDAILRLQVSICFLTSFGTNTPYTSGNRPHAVAYGMLRDAAVPLHR
jgi:hypothetical protein